MIAYNYPDPDNTNYLNETIYTDKPDYPKLIRIRAYNRWRLGKLEHVAAHWRYVYKF